MKNSNDTLGNLTGDFPAGRHCQQSAPLRPTSYMEDWIIMITTVIGTVVSLLAKLTVNVQRFLCGVIIFARF